MFLRVSVFRILFLKEDPQSAKARSALIKIELRHDKAEGTIKYQGRWQTIDHFFLSPAFFSPDSKFFTDSISGKIYDPDFLLEPDESYGGVKPFRTFNGMRYNGGVSDHLPVVLKIFYKSGSLSDK